MSDRTLTMVIGNFHNTHKHMNQQGNFSFKFNEPKINKNKAT